MIHFCFILTDFVLNLFAMFAIFCLPYYCVHINAFTEFYFSMCSLYAGRFFCIRQRSPLCLRFRRFSFTIYIYYTRSRLVLLIKSLEIVWFLFVIYFIPTNFEFPVVFFGFVAQLPKRTCCRTRRCNAFRSITHGLWSFWVRSKTASTTTWSPSSPTSSAPVCHVSVEFDVMNFHIELRTYLLDSWHSRHHPIEARIRGGRERLSFRWFARENGTRHPESSVHRGGSVQWKSVRYVGVQRARCGREGRWNYIYYIYFDQNEWSRIEVVTNRTSL